MKIETKVVRTFEEGDIIVNLMYNWVAIRVRCEGIPEGKWRHTNQVDQYPREGFGDQQVNDLLDHNTWVYIGNRVEREALENG